MVPWNAALIDLFVCHDARQCPGIDHTPRFKTLSSVIRLSHKYQIASLETQALSCLKAVYSDRLGPYDQFRYGLADAPFQLDLQCDWLREFKPYVVEIIHLAHLTDTTSMLPSAYYECVTTDTPGDMSEGWKREDGTVVHLSPEDVQRCVNGLRRLSAVTTQQILDTQRQIAGLDCEMDGVCRRSMELFYRDMLANTVDEDILDLLKRSWSSWLDDCGFWGKPDPDGPPCAQCLKTLKAHENQDRRNLWRRLPEIFDVSLTYWDGQACEKQCEYPLSVRGRLVNPDLIVC